MDRALLDTDILSEVLKGKNRSVSGRARAYRAHHKRFTISAATVMEVVQGLCRLDAHRQLGMFLDYLEDSDVISVDQDIAVLAGRIDGALSKEGQKIGVNDVLIAATSIQLGLTLVTGNFQHYDRISNVGFQLKLENWREA